MENKYTITIKNNENGEVLLEKKVNAIIAGIAAGDDASAVLLKGTHDEMIIAVNMVQDELDRLFEDDDI